MIMTMVLITKFTYCISMFATKNYNKTFKKQVLKDNFVVFSR